MGPAATAAVTAEDAGPTGSPDPDPAPPEADRASEATSRTGGPHPAPDPFTDADALDELAHEICSLEACIQVTLHRQLVLLADFDRRQGWALGGHRSCASWLHVAAGTHPVTARERVRVARALEGLPVISAAMARGELHYSKECAPYCTSLR